MHLRTYCQFCLKAYPIVNALRISTAQTCGRIVNPHFIGSPTIRHMHISRASRGLMEFFDDKQNWGADEVRVGRSWRVSELRAKSNQDLHKLWYILLKERNMLLTMQYYYEQVKHERLANPERLDKVEESMENIETVVKERNKAYYQLEVDQHDEGIRPTKHQRNELGMWVDRQLKEHSEPETEETRFQSRDPRTDEDVQQFIALLDEQTQDKRLKQNEKQFTFVVKLFYYYPDLDVEMMKRMFPDVDIEGARRHKDARGNRENLF